MFSKILLFLSIVIGISCQSQNDTNTEFESFECAEATIGFVHHGESIAGKLFARHVVSQLGKRKDFRYDKNPCFLVSLSTFPSCSDSLIVFSVKWYNSRVDSSYKRNLIIEKGGALTAPFMSMRAAQIAKETAEIIAEKQQDVKISLLLKELDNKKK